MRRRTFLQSLAGGAAATLAPFSLPNTLYALASPPPRGLLICPSHDGPATEAAQAIVAATQTHPLLRIMAATGTPKIVDAQRLLSGPPESRAYNHLILIGPPEDPLIQAAWQHEAKPEPGGLYIFGFGHLRGDVGYLESDRNPFLHGRAIASAPYETQVITLTGSSHGGIQLAVQAFLQQSLVNGVVATPGWTRPTPTLLDRDPITPAWSTPNLAPANLGNAQRIAWTQASEDEYRGVLADTGVTPSLIWRAKYFEPGNWDTPAAVGTFDNYAAGLHRRSYGNTLWLAQFANNAEAAAAAPKIAAAAHLRRAGATWQGDQVPYANATYPGEPRIPGTLTLAQSDSWLTLTAVQTRST